jgi:HSP20 family protein
MVTPARRTRTTVVPERWLPGWRDPLTEFQDLFGQISHLLETTVGGVPVTERAWAPPADLAETDEAYEVDIELPGAKSEDIDIEINERELVVTGEVKERERKGALRRSTRRMGRFEFRAALPGEVVSENVSAKLADGILSVTVPKVQAAKPRHIQISSGSESR